MIKPREKLAASLEILQKSQSTFNFTGITQNP